MIRGIKSREILLLCSEEPCRFSEITQAVAISESGLAKNLSTLERMRLVAKTDSGYFATDIGREVADQLRREDEARRQRLARKLMTLQNLVSSRDLLKFENLRALLNHSRRSLHSYEALAVSYSIEASYFSEHELGPEMEAAIYEEALNLLRHLPTNPTSTVSVTVRFSLEQGYRTMLRILREDVDDASAKERPQLESIMTQMQQRKDEVMRDAVMRFLR